MATPLTLGLLGLLCGGVGAQTQHWDCRPAADGNGWQCDGGDAAPSQAPAPAQVPVPAPAQAQAPAPAQAQAQAQAQEMVTAAPPGDVTTTPARPLPAAPASSPTAPAAAGAAATAASTAPRPAAAATRAEAPKAPAAEGRAPEAAPPAPVADAPAAPALAPIAPAHGDRRAALDEGIDWGACQLTTVGAPQIELDTSDDDQLPIEAVADGIVGELGVEQATLSGDVELTKGRTRVQADELRFNRLTGELDAAGDVLLTRPDIRLAGDKAHYQMDTRQGQVEQASYRVPAARARGDAAQAELLGQGLSRYREINYTTCQPGDASWLLSADTLDIDQNEGFGTARHATLRFKGVPILYAPWFTFPTDDRRRSGLLVPRVGQTSNTGFDLSVPYYFNLAENYDLTLTPRIMSKRGAMLGGEFRFLTHSSRGELAAEYLPDDREYGDARGSLSFKANASLAPRLTSNVRLNYASDSDYLRDLGESLAITSSTHLERTGELRYFGDTWDLLGRLQQYQTIDPRIPRSGRPYSRLPQLRFDLRDPDGLVGTNYLVDAEYVNFHREDSVRGHRLNLFPRISLPLRRDWGYVEPKLGAHMVAYQLTDQTPGLDDSPSSVAGTFSLDSGLFFDRSTSYFGNAATQTLEPRLYYLYVPKVDQDEQPVFDTGLFDFNFDNLFRENRFNGPDRFGDANQVTLALTSRVNSVRSGTELLRASIGQTLYFADREVTLPGETQPDDSTSSLVGELAAALGGGWRARAGLQWDPNEGNNGNIDQALAQLTYHDESRHTLNLAYRLRDEVTEQTDLAFVWPINASWSVIGRHNHSLQDDRLLEALLGVEYGRCCWRVRALARRYADGNGDDTNMGFFIQLELNGLGRLGDDIDEVLLNSIYGYRTEYQ